MAERIKVNNEQKLLILCSQIDMNFEDEQEVQALLEEKLNWGYFIDIAIKHKVLQLVSKHIIRLDKDSKIHGQYKRFFEYSYLGNKRRNIQMFDQLKQVMKEFNKNNIVAIPLKGVMLIPKVYKDMGLRSINDLDFLISVDNRKIASDTLKHLGFNMGLYNVSTNQFNPITRKEEILWNNFAGNMYPHTKLLDDDFVKYVEVDFSYDVDLKGDYHASNLLLANAVEEELLGVKTNVLEPTDFLIHIAIHLYKEATNVQWVMLHADLNLIKFFDLREYTKYLSDKIEWSKVVERAKELKAENALFYSYYYLDYIYGDNYSNELKKYLEITDTSFLSQYGFKDYSDVKEWKKTFSERFFSLDNTEEVSEKSNYQKFIETP